MKNKFLLLRGILLKDLLGERVEEYENFSKDRKSRQKRTCDFPNYISFNLEHRQLIPLWKFILHLLHRDVDSKYVEWSKDNSLQFQIKDPTSVAELWGSMKYKSDMTYEKLARAMRYYYGKSIIEKVSGKRYSYRFVLSNKTRNHITKFVNINGSTVTCSKTVNDSPTALEDSTDDDTASTSSLTSNESNSSSVCSIPDQDQEAPRQKVENEVKYEEPLLEFSSVPLQEPSSSTSLAIPAIKKIMPSMFTQQNRTEKHVNMIKKSNMRLQSTDPGHTSAFSPLTKALGVKARNVNVREKILRETDRNNVRSRKQLRYNHDRIMPSAMYDLKVEPNIFTDPTVGPGDNTEKEQGESMETLQEEPDAISRADIDSNETETVDIIPTLLISTVGRTELNANVDIGPFTTSNCNNDASKLHRKDPFMGCVDGRNENLAACSYSCDVFGDFC